MVYPSIRKDCELERTVFSSLKVVLNTFRLPSLLGSRYSVARTFQHEGALATQRADLRHALRTESVRCLRADSGTQFAQGFERARLSRRAEQGFRIWWLLFGSIPPKNPSGILRLLAVGLHFEAQTLCNTHHLKTSIFQKEDNTGSYSQKPKCL